MPASLCVFVPDDSIAEHLWTDGPSHGPIPMTLAAIISQCRRRNLGSNLRGKCMQGAVSISTISSQTKANYPLHLRRELLGIIKAKGPLTVAEFMRLVNTHPKYGYYTYKEVFGERGDFVTAPEISQMFGEILAAFIMHSLWPLLQVDVDARRKINIIELGPGRGTLLTDLLRVFLQFDGFKERINGCYLVEQSPKLRELQAKILRSAFPHLSFTWDPIIDETLVKTSNDGCLNVVYSNEFFDALPIYSFQKDSKGEWKDVLIDALDTGDDVAFRFVAAPHASPLKTVFNLLDLAEGPFAEISLESKIINDQIAKHLLKTGGLYLNVDYGRAGLRSLKNTTLRAIKNHQILDNPLQDVGECDLSADVDFEAVKESFPSDNFHTIGPVDQGHFLKSFGIESRCKSLCRDKPISTCLELEAGMKRLIAQDQMGTSYKVFAAIAK